MIKGKVHLIVFANEKGGTGKSTTAVHVAVALAAQGRKVAALDLDSRQRTMARYFENRIETSKRLGKELATPNFATIKGDTLAEFDNLLASLSARAEFLVIDTPGRDDKLARASALRADTLVTPMNDSFVDLDLIGQVDGADYKVKKPSFYAELIFEARRDRAKSDGDTIDWVVLRNRLAQFEARNMRRVGAAMEELSRRVGFRVIPGLSERVIYRELFPSGMTLLDLDLIKDAGLSHIAARQEMRELVAALALPAHQLSLVDA
jgi:chromosome partitioning protein